jgi:hypothetical protein
MKKTTADLLAENIRFLELLVELIEDKDKLIYEKEVLEGTLLTIVTLKIIKETILKTQLQKNNFTNN